VSRQVARHSVLLFPDYFPQAAVLQFDHRQGSSDGGALLLKAADRRYGLIACMADCLRDQRQAGKVDHSLKELVAQRVFANRVRLSGRQRCGSLWPPIRFTRCSWAAIRGAGRDLASQPTLSRFENAIGAGNSIVWVSVGGQRDAAPCRAVGRSCPPRHPSIWTRLTIPPTGRSSVYLLQRALRHLVLPAGDGFPQLQ